MVISLGIGIWIEFEDYKNDRVLHSVSAQEVPKALSNKSNILSKSQKSEKMDKDQLDPHGERNEEEVRLLKLKELF